MNSPMYIGIVFKRQLFLKFNYAIKPLSSGSIIKIYNRSAINTS